MTFKVAKECCNQCLFSQNKIVSNARRRNILSDCRKKDNHFICHKFTIAGNQDVCCKGFYETQTSQMIRIAQRLNVVEFVELPEEHD